MTIKLSMELNNTLKRNWYYSLVKQTHVGIVEQDAYMLVDYMVYLDLKEDQEKKDSSK